MLAVSEFSNDRLGKLLGHMQTSPTCNDASSRPADSSGAGDLPGLATVIEYMTDSAGSDRAGQFASDEWQLIVLTEPSSLQVPAKTVITPRPGLLPGKLVARLSMAAWMASAQSW